MFNNLGDRRNQISIFLMFFFALLILRLGYITIIEGDYYREKSVNNRMKQIPIVAKRGEIYDRNGKLLASNVPAYTVQLMGSNLGKEELNAVSLRIMNILEKRNEKHILFPIQLDGKGFYYTFDREKENWLTEKGFDSSETAESIFSYYRESEGVPSNLSNGEAFTFLMNKGIILPISTKKMLFWQEVKKAEFLEMYQVPDLTSAKDAFAKIRIQKNFAIPEEKSDQDALKILTIKHALKEKGYMKYDPIKIADNISKETAILIKELSMDLPGIDVVVEPIRTYPYNDIGSHILGYMGKISSEYEIEKYVTENKYNSNQLIGKVGIEGNLELDLNGKNGYKFIQVDALGKLVQEVENGIDGEKTTPAKAGKDVYLTIDIDLQQKAEQHLKDTLAAIQTGGTYKSPWGNYKFTAFPNAKTGAAVVVNVKNGEILAMASEPNYDLNLFATGISLADWDKLSPENPKDPLSPRPLYNIATMTAVQPGSTYKMATGFAAMEKGLNPERGLKDGGYVELGSHQYGCWIWNQSHGSHGIVDLRTALAVSCNYYFFDVSMGYDYYNEKGLGYSMKSQDLLDTSKKFGLGVKSGIEIEESSGGVPSPDEKKTNLLITLRAKLRQNAYDYFLPELAKNADKLNEYINTIISWADENPSRGEIIKRLKAMKIINKNSSAEKVADVIKYDYFNMVKWSEGDQLNLAIGQGDHRYTPLQMARYTAAIANGGYLYDFSLVRKVGDDLVNKNEGIKSFDLNGYTKYLRQGMKEVTMGARGTARSIFGHFPVAVAGKTGTAQNQGKIPPKNEKEYLKRYLRSINPRLTFAQVEVKAKEVLKVRSLEIATLQKQANAEINKDAKKKLVRKMENMLASGYLTEESALKAAIIQLSDNKIGYSDITKYQADYDNYAWFVSFAPYDDPEIAVVVLIPQGGHGGYAGPVARDIIADYLGLNPDNYNFGNITGSGATSD